MLLVAILVLAGCSGNRAAAVPPTLTPVPPTIAPLPPTPTPLPPTLTPVPPKATPAPSATPTAPVIVAIVVTPEATAAAPPPSEEPTIAQPAPGSGQTEVATTALYVFPVQGARVDYGASHHDYPATDMFCQVGSLFVAPTNGVIDFVSREDLWNPANDDPALRGGLSIALVGDDGVRYYGSHLSEVAAGIEPGVRVTAGQLLGLTGKSGNARSTPSHLHFGISHPTTPDDWQVRRGEISPFVYLNAWRRGENLPPLLP